MTKTVCLADRLVGIDQSLKLEHLSDKFLNLIDSHDCHASAHDGCAICASSWGNRH